MCTLMVMEVVFTIAIGNYLQHPIQELIRKTSYITMIVFQIITDIAMTFEEEWSN